MRPQPQRYTLGRTYQNVGTIGRISIGGNAVGRSAESWRVKRVQFELVYPQAVQLGLDADGVHETLT